MSEPTNYAAAVAQMLLENKHWVDEIDEQEKANHDELARSYMAIRSALQSAIDITTQRILDAEETIEKVKKILNQ